MKKKIMIVDDSSTVRNILKATMLDKYEIVEASNGQEAYDSAQQVLVDLFLLDVNMPVMDGITLVGKLRTLAQYGKTPMIMLTTESRDDKKNQGKNAGATGWIVKPCEPEKILAVIEKML